MSTTGIRCLRFLRYLSVYLLVVFSLLSCTSGYKDCSSQIDCNYGLSCCVGHCVYSTDCIGYSCSDDSDCQSWGTCCDGTCSDDCFTTDYGAIVGIVIGSFIFVCLLSLCCYYARYRLRQHYRGGVIVESRVTATTVTTRCATQSNIPYQNQGQIPPPYQRSYHPYNPPPQYVQHPPYNAGSAKSSEPPPPYSIGPVGRPGGVYTPQSNYGAVQTPSAPHLEQ